MPGDAAACSDSAKLVNDVARNEVDVVVPKAELGVPDAVST